MEENLNGVCKVDYEYNGCKMKHGAENIIMIKSCRETNFLIVLFRGVIHDDSGPVFL